MFCGTAAGAVPCLAICLTGRFSARPGGADTGAVTVAGVVSAGGGVTAGCSTGGVVTGVWAGVVAVLAGAAAGDAFCSACALFFRHGPNWITATRANAVASAPAPTHSQRLLDFGAACCGTAAAAGISGGDGLAGAGVSSGMVTVVP